MARADIFEDLLESFHGLDDSKKLTEKKREELFLAIEASQYRSECQFAFAYRDAWDIDTIWIREANRLSMQDVLLSLLQYTDTTDSVEIYIDWSDDYIFDIGYDSIWYSLARSKREKKYNVKMDDTEQIKIYYKIRWDSEYRQIAAASIVAKVIRDRMMCDFHEDFPEYGFDTHKGYGTAKHQEAMLHYGISPIHRKSYAPVKSLILNSSSV